MVSFLRMVWILLIGEAWKWCRRLFSWEEKLLEECVILLTAATLQVDCADRWVWTLHASNFYIVSSAYSFLTKADNDHNQHYNKFMWLKAVPLKVLIFDWRLFLNRFSTRDNLFHRCVLLVSKQSCVANYGSNEDIDHLFLNSGVFGVLLQLVAGWLGFSTTFHDSFF